MLCAGLSKVLAHIRAAAFAAWTFTLAVPLFITMMVLALPVMVFDKFRWVSVLAIAAAKSRDCAGPCWATL